MLPRRSTCIVFGLSVAFLNASLLVSAQEVGTATGKTFAPYERLDYSERVERYVDHDYVKAHYNRDEFVKNERLNKLILTESDYAKIDNEAQELLSRINDNGSLNEYIKYIGSVRRFLFNKGNEQFEHAVRDWIRLEPESCIPYLLAGRYNQDLGWEARGGGYANTVTPGAAEIFLERLGMAKAAFNKALELDPENPYALHSLITLTLSLGEGPKAVGAAYQRAIKAYPYSVLARAWYLNSLYPKWGGTWIQAETFVAREMMGFEQNPALVSLHLEFVDEQERFREGYEDFDKQDAVVTRIIKLLSDAHKALPNDLHIARLLYYWSSKIKDYETQYAVSLKIGNTFDAFDNFRTAAQYHYLRMHGVRNYALTFEGDERKKFLDELVEIAPNWPDTWEKLSFYYRSQGDNEKMVECFEKALHLNTNEFSVCMNLINVAAQAERYHDALAYIDYAESLSLKEDATKHLERTRNVIEARIRRAQ